MTFDDDMIQLEFRGHVRRFFCKRVGLSWPPPEILNVNTFLFRRKSFSQISDEDRQKTTHLIRGARYEPIMPGESEMPEGMVTLDPGIVSIH